MHTKTLFLYKAFVPLLFAALMLLSLGCAGQSAAPEAAATAQPTQLDRSNAGLTDADLAALYSQTSLTSLDLRGNELSPDAIASLQAALPDCAILWSVPLGSARFDSDSASITLPADATADALNNLRRGHLRIFAGHQHVNEER